MPITLKKGILKYKNTSTGQYEGVDVVAETATSDQVEAIEDAASAEISAIEAKGAETRESIPDDYTALSDEVDELKSAVDSFINLRELFAFEVGSINVSGQNADSSSRIRSKYMIWAKAGTAISYTSNDLAIVQYSDRSGTLISDNYWIGSYTLPQDCYIRIVVNNTADVDAVWNGLTIKFISDKLKIEYEMLSDTVSKEVVSLNKSVGLPLLKKTDFESGNIQMTSSGWAYGADQERARTKSGVTYTIKKGTKIHIANGYVAYFGWKINDTYYNSGSWKDTIYEAPADGEYVFLIRFSTESVDGFFTDNAFDAISLELSTRITEVDYSMLTNQAKQFSLAVSGVASSAILPDYNTTTQKLTLYKGTRLLSHDGTSLVNLGSNVELAAVQTSNNNVLVFNTNTQEFALMRFGANLSNAPYIVLGEINIYNGNGHIQCGHTVNGYPVAAQKIIDDFTLTGPWNSRVQEIQTAQCNKFTFAVQTDTHYMTDNGTKVITSNISDIKNFKTLTHYIGFDFVCNLGDITQGYENDTNDNMRSSMTEALEAYTTNISCPFMVAMGNHERNTMYATAQGVDPLSFAEIWGRMFKPAFNTNPKAITQSGLMYYYSDFDDVRVIVLNTQDGTNGGFGIGADQLSWFVNNALNTSKAVLVLSHVPLVDGWSVASNYDSSFAGIVSALQTFISNNKTVIGCMSGHIHKQEAKKIDGINYVAFDYQTGKAEVVQVDLANRSIATFIIGNYGSDIDRSFTY